jgi:hypothetical protein
LLDTETYQRGQKTEAREAKAAQFGFRHNSISHSSTTGIRSAIA